MNRTAGRLTQLALILALVGCTDTTDTAVRIEALSYEPRELVVAVGDTVIWVNDDPLRHTVTAGDPDDPDPDFFDIEMAGEGDSAEFTLDTAGVFRYFCDVHKPMRATIIVE